MSRPDQCSPFTPTARLALCSGGQEYYRTAGFEWNVQICVGASVKALYR